MITEKYCNEILQQYPEYITKDQMIAIGNPLRLSPDFPPLSTVHASFPAHGAPSVLQIHSISIDFKTSET